MNVIEYNVIRPDKSQNMYNRSISFKVLFGGPLHI